MVIRELILDSSLTVHKTDHLITDVMLSINWPTVTQL